MGFKIEPDKTEPLMSKEQAKDLIEEALKEGTAQGLIEALPGDGGWRSRKLLLTIGGVILIVLSMLYLEVSPDLGVATISGLIASYSASNAMAKGKG